MLCCFWCLYILSLCYIFNLYILTSCGVVRILWTNVYETEECRSRVPLVHPCCRLVSQNGLPYKTRPGRRHYSFRHNIGWKCSVGLRHAPPPRIKLRKPRGKVRLKLSPGLLKVQRRIWNIDGSAVQISREDEKQRVLRVMEWESGGESLKMAGEEDEMEEEGPNKDRKRRM